MVESTLKEELEDNYDIISNKYKNRLFKCAEMVFWKEHNMTSFSGIVIAGYGDDEYYPSIFCFEINGLTNGILKYKPKGMSKVDERRGASIIPFAQHEMVYTFMEGIDREYELEIHERIFNTFFDFTKAMISGLDKYDEEEKEKLIQVLLEENVEKIEQMLYEFDSIKENCFREPIMAVVDNFQKVELAQMAETLVNLTSFKRRMSAQEETVGGPVDVALITKGDGFIWIKRKHYFDKELNLSFFNNYFNKDDNNGKEK